ncbi:hypothetical protein O9G_005668 [Rozella allomycis CSF55]|uniref:Uncharacterized protein n=1 Tax=Rozella allomycis (strain CSF55) TaxID=988480 RepID=A0A075AX05_ROZAC|nr:hypothetical protein O9G_005668 [Rozella allomycis CSF55]|eukprot:EPZ34787.1 hypothetical protein O9G_005668 [Rozella allomycis CSF55]
MAKENNNTKYATGVQLTGALDYSVWYTALLNNSLWDNVTDKPVNNDKAFEAIITNVSTDILTSLTLRQLHEVPAVWDYFRKE